jgi:riboflavin transporter FmnP
MLLIINDCAVMNTRSIAIIITFTALCIVLIPLRIPTVFWPGFNYYFWEIPIVAAFLLFGFKIALSISVLNTLARMVILPLANPLIIPLINFQPVLTMLLGVYLAQKLVLRRASEEKSISDARKGMYVTALGVAVRAGIMPFIDYVNYHTVFPFFFGPFSEAYIIALMPGIVVFNVLVPLYGVSVGYLVAKTVGKSLKIGPEL